MTRKQQITEALNLLAPPRGKRKQWRGQIAFMLDIVDDKSASDELEDAGSKQGKAKLTRYADALREVQASYNALNPSMQRFFLLETDRIKHDIIEAKAMSEHFPRRPSNRPANITAKAATKAASILLTQRGWELTTERSGHWHTLTQILANTSKDLRHHMTGLAGGKV
jgi:hypothetical protein